MTQLTMRRLAFAVAAIISAPIPALAQGQDQMAEYRRNCASDYTRLCSAYDPDSPQVRQCFATRQAELSPRCAATIAKYQGRR